MKDFIIESLKSYRNIKSGGSTAGFFNFIQTTYEHFINQMLKGFVAIGHENEDLQILFLRSLEDQGIANSLAAKFNKIEQERHLIYPHVGGDVWQYVYKDNGEKKL